MRSQCRPFHESAPPRCSLNPTAAHQDPPDLTAVLVDEHGLTKIQLLDDVGMDGEALGASCRAQSCGAQQIDLGGMLDRVLGANEFDHGGDIIIGIEALDQIAIAAGEDLANEVVRPVGDGPADIGDALGRKDTAHASASPLVDQIQNLITGKHAELIEDSGERRALMSRLGQLGRGSAFEVIDHQPADEPRQGWEL